MSVSNFNEANDFKLCLAKQVSYMFKLRCDWGIKTGIRSGHCQYKIGHNFQGHLSAWKLLLCSLLALVTRPGVRCSSLICGFMYHWFEHMSI